MLEIKDLHVNYGAVHALNGVSMTVNDGEIVSLIGAKRYSTVYPSMSTTAALSRRRAATSSATKTCSTTRPRSCGNC